MSHKVIVLSGNGSCDFECERLESAKSFCLMMYEIIEGEARKRVEDAEVVKSEEEVRETSRDTASRMPEYMRNYYNIRTEEDLEDWVERSVEREMDRVNAGELDAGDLTNASIRIWGELGMDVYWEGDFVSDVGGVEVEDQVRDDNFYKNSVVLVGLVDEWGSYKSFKGWVREWFKDELYEVDMGRGHGLFNVVCLVWEGEFCLVVHKGMISGVK